MLRRDGSAFYTMLDEVRSTNDRQRRRIKLVTTYAVADRWEPLAPRWESFRWKVVEHNDEPVDLSPGPVASPPTPDSPRYTEAYYAMLEALKAFPGFTDDAKVGDAWVERVRAVVDKAEGRS
jgi:hypothetical protein